MRIIIGVVLGAALLALTGQQSTQAQDPCASLKGLVIPASAIGKPTSGAQVTAAAVTDNYCKVTGAIRPVDRSAPDINFQVNLPADWNGKAVHFGGAGYNGSVVTGMGPTAVPPGVRPAIAQGYATFGSDSGHQTRPGAEPAAFASNREALVNFGGDQLKKTRDVAMALIERRYGRAARRTYFYGGSQGGHEAFLAIQRWPADYDGAVALYPVYDMMAVQTNGTQVGQIVFRSPGAWISGAKGQVVTDRVIAACDGLDGAADGIVSNVEGCRASFDPRTLICAGPERPDCLTHEQVATLQALASDRPLGVTLSGVSTFARWPVLEGAPLGGRGVFGASVRPASPPTMADGFIYFMGDQGVRHIGLLDPKADTLKFAAPDHAAKLQEASRIIDASSDDLRAFRRRGGKLLMLHGTLDMAVTPHNTHAYWRRLENRFGAGLKDFARYYVVPGYGHGNGAFNVGWDGLGALDAWVEQKKAPANLVGTDLNPQSNRRTRPLCEFGTWPRYRGSGDVNAAASFSCVR